MKKYLVVHHRKDTHQPWTNSWLDDQRLEAIQTTKQVAELCQDALSSDEVIYVHRCASSMGPPSICCALKVWTVQHIASSNWLVRFKDQQPLNAMPPVQPRPGQNSYFA